ncbi:MAG: hypothetical protein ACOX7R_05440 [Acetivibrionales bacterium]
MNRVEKFRNIRREKRKYMFILLLCILLLTSGLCAADYSVNSLMKNDNGIRLITFEYNGSYAKLSLLNSSIYINTSYISRDLGRIMEAARENHNMK